RRLRHDDRLPGRPAALLRRVEPLEGRHEPAPRGARRRHAGGLDLRRRVTAAAAPSGSTSSGSTRSGAPPPAQPPPDAFSVGASSSTTADAPSPAPPSAPATSAATSFSRIVVFPVAGNTILLGN